MINDVDGAPFVHVEDHEPMGRSYDPYNKVWDDYHKKQRSLPVLAKAFWQKICRQSKRLDAWCDESPFHYLVVMGLGVILVMVLAAVYVYAFLL